ncbi:collagen alpha-4(IV) chain-like [Penaeus vannamei]|uniref:collagen alpha-4(IV) chain-like n=1 Tax=Penaeus vannamei TaxID=6689 RepID=UPI00387F3D36
MRRSRRPRAAPPIPPPWPSSAESLFPPWLAQGLAAGWMLGGKGRRVSALEGPAEGGQPLDAGTFPPAIRLEQDAEISASKGCPHPPGPRAPNPVSPWLAQGLAAGWMLGGKGRRVSALEGRGEGGQPLDAGTFPPAIRLEQDAEISASKGCPPHPPPLALERRIPFPPLAGSRPGCWLDAGRERKEGLGARGAGGRRAALGRRDLSSSHPPRARCGDLGVQGLPPPSPPLALERRIPFPPLAGSRPGCWLDAGRERKEGLGARGAGGRRAALGRRDLSSSHPPRARCGDLGVQGLPPPSPPPGPRAPNPVSPPGWLKAWLLAGCWAGKEGGSRRSRGRRKEGSPWTPGPFLQPSA